tara:strand:+ start:464 stop:733 length:270 start_codon:yes stop_codon:yes gene_type:complete
VALYSSTHITQKYIRRYGRTARVKAWESKIVHIQTENGVWRVDAHGYTYAGKPDAWILPFTQAEKEISHCGPEKCGAFLLAAGQSEVNI